MNASLAIDLLVSVLLIATCAYCVRLNLRLKTLRDGQSDLAKAIEAFDAATIRASETLKALETSGSARSIANIEIMRRAQSIHDELAVMVSAGDRVAVRIEEAVGDVRNLGARRKASATAKSREAA